MCRWLCTGLMLISWVGSVAAQESMTRAQQYRQAVALEESGRHDEAITIYQSLLKDQAKDPWVLYELAASYGGKQDYAACVRYAKQGANIKSEMQSAAYTVWGNCLDSAGKNSQARSVYAKGVKKFPKDVRLQYNYAIALVQAGEVVKAVQALKVCMDEAPEYSSPYFFYATLLGGAGSDAGEALMGLKFLMVEPEGERAILMVNQIQKRFKAVSERYDKENKRPVNHVSAIALWLERDLVDFDLVYPGVINKARSAASARGLSESDQFVWSATALLTVLANEYSATRQDGQLWQHAYRSLHTLSERGVLDTWLYHVAAIAELPGAQSWLNAHDAELLGLKKVMDEFPGGRL